MDNPANRDPNDPLPNRPLLRIIDIVIATADVVMIVSAVLWFLVPLANQPKNKEPNIAVCTSPTCINEAHQLLQQIDPNVNPCQNFHKFVCMKNSFQDFTTSLKSDVIEQIIKLYKEPPKNNEHIMVKAMKKLYKTCLKEASENWVAKNIGIVKDAVKEAGGWPLLEGSKWDETKFDWVKATYKFRELGYYYKVFVDISIVYYPVNEKKCMGWVLLPKLSVIEKTAAAEVAILLGAKRQLTSDTIDEVNNYISQLYQANVTRDNDSCQPLTALELTIDQYQQRQGFTINWLEFINKIVAPAAKISKNDTMLFLQPEKMTTGLQLLLKTPKRILANYMMWKVVMEIAPNVLVSSPEELFAATLSPKIATPAEVGCLNQIEKQFGAYPNPIGMLYVNKHLPTGKRSMVENMARNIKAAFLDVLGRANWTNSKYKRTIINNIKKITMIIGAPQSHFDEKIFDIINVDMQKADGSDFLHLMLQIRRNYESLAYKQLHNSPLKVKSLFWNLMHATEKALGNSVDLFPKHNVIEIPATILQGKLFNENRPNYLNYGYLGSIISNQFAMLFTKLLLLETEFVNKAKGPFERAENWETGDVTRNLVFCETCANGTRLCKIVDGWPYFLLQQALGQTTAYMAYERWTESNGVEPTLPIVDHTNQRLFWIAAMSSYCQTPNCFKNDMQSFFMSIVVLCNKATFSKDFNCPTSNGNDFNNCYEF